MKKLFVLVLGLVAVYPAFGDNCERKSVWNDSNEYLVIDGLSGAYECDNEDCAVGTRIAALTPSRAGGEKKEDAVIWVCRIETGGDYWEPIAMKECEDDYKNVTNHKRDVYKHKEGGEISVLNEGGSMVISGGEVCKGKLCESGYVLNAGKTDCVTPDSLCKADVVYVDNKCVEKKSGCEATGGKWESNKTCTCDASKNIKQKTSDKYSCECSSSSYSWYSNKVQGCYNKAAQSAREKCVNSGGSWNGSSCSCSAAKHLKLSNGECICESADYAFNSSTKQCELTDVANKKRICDSATSIATWNAIENKCICNDKNKTFDESTITCVSPSGYDDCIAHSDITIWENGVCKCKQSGYIWNGSACIEGDDIVLKGIVENIEVIEKRFDTSKWKDAEGKFNTARFASDSVVGIVLGTVGGVVTSTVMKKSQIKNGFEDLKCVIGGQTVASWDDQFSVGLR